MAWWFLIRQEIRLHGVLLSESQGQLYLLTSVVETESLSILVNPSFVSIEFIKFVFS
jgi:hypothetical protein